MCKLTFNRVLLFAILVFMLKFTVRAASVEGEGCLSKVVCVRELSVDATNIEAKRDPFFPEYQSSEWNKGMALNWNTDFLKTGDRYLAYWNNRMFFDTINADAVYAPDGSTIRRGADKVEHIGWQYEVGTHLLKGQDSGIDLFYQHESQHAADTEAPGYPIDNRVGIRLILLQR